MKKKTFVMILALVLVLGLAVGGTIAYLTSSTDEVVNTFTIGKVEIDLYEHPLKVDADGKTDGKTIDTTKDPVKAVEGYQMMPGRELQKDPTVEVKTGSEDCWVFVKVTEANNALTSDATKKYINWTVDTANWEVVDADNNVYGSKVVKSAGDTVAVLTDDKVTVSQEVTSADTATPTLTFIAYAVQAEGFDTAAAAWAATFGAN
ncbi:MAG: SipW-dependent-type signal peptide-containing protein [Clostridia bacterium]|nr:SipW-dependent-type signal peptide-containing protein [Clostridia bacterium]